MQVSFYLAGEITQVLDPIPWVRCASGNVYVKYDDDDDSNGYGGGDHRLWRW